MLNSIQFRPQLQSQPHRQASFGAKSSSTEVGEESIRKDLGLPPGATEAEVKKEFAKFELKLEKRILKETKKDLGLSPGATEAEVKNAKAKKVGIERRTRLGLPSTATEGEVSTGLSKYLEKRRAE